MSSGYDRRLRGQTHLQEFDYAFGDLHGKPGAGHRLVCTTPAPGSELNAGMFNTIQYHIRPTGNPHLSGPHLVPWPLRSRIQFMVRRIDGERSYLNPHGKRGNGRVGKHEVVASQ